MKFDENERDALKYWLRMGTWSKREAFMLLCGANPDKPDVPHMHALPCFDDFEPADAFEKRQELDDHWNREQHDQDSYPPAHFISWAQSLSFEIPWPTEEKGGQDEATQTAENRETEKTIHPRTERSYLRIIAALLEFIEGSTPGVEPHPAFTNETSLIAELSKHYSGYEGLSESNLSRKFPEARQALKNS